MNTLVSVVIPTYGKPERLTTAIDSVLAQDYEPIEIIIVDDNGKGTEYQLETQIEINRYLELGENIKYICHQTNKNGSVARNTAIKNAKGDYIALLDDDDVFLPDKISRQVKAISSLIGEYKACYASFSIYFPDGRNKDVFAEPISDISLGILNKSVEIPSSSLMFSKASWEKIGGFDESFSRHQDWEFITRLGRITKFATVTNICMNRIICRRNTPNDPEVARKYREHYLKKMSKIISSYPKKVQKNIIYIHRIDLAVNYLKSKNYYVGLIQLFNSGKFLHGLFDISKRMYTYKKALKEVTYIGPVEQSK